MSQPAGPVPKKKLQDKKIKSEAGKERYLKISREDGIQTDTEIGRPSASLEHTKARRKKSVRSKDDRPDDVSSQPENDDTEPYLSEADGMRYQDRKVSSDVDSDGYASSAPALQPHKVASNHRKHSMSSPSSHGARHQRQSHADTLAIIEHEKTRRTKETLLKWTKEFLKAYPDITVTDLESFGDGSIFLAFINSYDPSIICFEEFDRSDRNRTLEAAFSIAEDFMGIPNLLDAESVLYDQRSLLMYISMFKSKIEDAKKASNPVNAAQTYIQDLKKTVHDRIDATKSLLAEFSDEIGRLQAISSKDEFEQERQFYTARMQAMEKIRQESRTLTTKQEQMNNELRNQNQLLMEKISTLEKLVDFEKVRANKAEQIVGMEERVRALGELLGETDIMQFYNQHKDAVDILKAKYKPRTSTVSGGGAPIVPFSAGGVSRRDSISK